MIVFSNIYKVSFDVQYTLLLLPSYYINFGMYNHKCFSLNFMASF